MALEWERLMFLMPQEEYGWPEEFFGRILGDNLAHRAEALSGILGEDGREEFLHLEFKTAPRDPSKPDTWAKQNYAKAVSAFANAEGGVIVWGVKWGDNLQERSSAPDPVGVENAEAFKNWLQAHRKDATSPPVPDVRSVVTDHDGKLLVLTYVGKSDMAPHMAHMADEHRYYRRAGDGTRKMEAYEIEDLFGRRAGPVLIPRVLFHVIRKADSRVAPTLDVTWNLWNHGRGMATLVCFELGAEVFDGDSRVALHSKRIMLPVSSLPTGDNLPTGIQRRPQREDEREVLACHIPPDGPPVPPSSYAPIARTRIDAESIATELAVNGSIHHLALRIELDWRTFSQGMRPKRGVVDCRFPNGHLLRSEMWEDGTEYEISCEPFKVLVLDVLHGKLEETKAFDVVPNQIT